MGSLTSTGLLDTGLLGTDSLSGLVRDYILNEDSAMPFVDFTGINENLSFLVLTTDSGGIAVDSDAPPGYSILDARTGTVLVTNGVTTKLPIEIGAYAVIEQITTAKGFATGYTYTLLAKWLMAGLPYQQQYTFKVD